MTETREEKIKSPPAEQKERPKEEREDSNVVFIGTKPFMNYVSSVIIQMTAKNKKEVVIKARGKFIHKAVDVAEVTKKRYLENRGIEVKNIRIGSEEFENKENRKINVSTIEITLEKK